MDENLFDNTYVISSIEALELIKSFAQDNFICFKIDEEYNHKSGHWGIRYLFKDTVIFINSDRGWLAYGITINDIRIALEKFDPNLQCVRFASRKNLVYVLMAIQNYWQNNH